MNKWDFAEVSISGYTDSSTNLVSVLAYSMSNDKNTYMEKMFARLR